MATQKTDNPILLFDTPTTDPRRCWSLNVWKTRLVLNYKNLPYETRWVDYPDIGSTLSAMGIPPSPELPHHSVPTIQLPNEELVMDSLTIATRLEALQPQPGLHLDLDIHQEVTDAVMQTLWPLLPIVLHRSVYALPERNRDWYLTERAKIFNMPLPELERQRGGESAWKAAEPAMETLSKLLTKWKRDQGPYLLGSEVSYGDFVLAALLQGMQTTDTEMYQRYTSFFGDSLKSLHKACGMWLSRDDH